MPGVSSLLACSALDYKAVVVLMSLRPYASLFGRELPSLRNAS